MLNYLLDSVAVFITAHQSGYNMLDANALRLYALGRVSKWLENK